MKKKTMGMIAGGLGLAFACAGGLWSFYPENRQETLTIIQNAGAAAGLLEPPPAPPAPVASFVRAGFTPPAPAAQQGQQRAAAPALSYLPDIAVQGCSADGQVVRLAYGIAIVEDERRAALLSHPAISGNPEKYTRQRRSDIAALVEAQWKAEIAALNTQDAQANSGTLSGLNFRKPQAGASLQSWLNERAQEIYAQLGIKVGFRVNAASGAQVLAPRSNAIDACTPAGRMPAPLENVQPPNSGGPRPF